MKWNASHLERLLKDGKIKGYTSIGVAPKKKAKYGNSKVYYGGKVFDSKKEYRKYRELLLRLKIGEIGQLECQVEYLLIEANETERKCCYIADFRWLEVKTGELVVCDVKSDSTRKLSIYIMKRKLMLSKYKIKILEV